MKNLVASLFLCAAAACAQQVGYNFSQDADFNKFKTYKWVEIKGSETLDQLTEAQLRSALDTELAKKNLTKSTSDNADLYIGYQVALKSEKQFTSFDTGWGYGPGWRGRGMGSTMTTGQTSTITVGSLVLDMYDPVAKQLVWRGTATNTVEGNLKPEQRDKKFRKGAEKLLKNYPPKKKK